MDPSSVRSRKRTRSSSSSTSCDELINGTFTRSKSQIYIHRNRSGYARPDSTRTRFIKGPTDSSLLFPTNEVVDLDVKVKDLRSRRVFSPASISDNDGDDGFGDGGDDVSKVGEIGGGDVSNGGELGDGFGDDVSKVGESGVDDVSKKDKVGGDGFVDDVSKVGEVCEKMDGGGVAVTSDDVSKGTEVDVCNKVSVSTMIDIDVKVNNGDVVKVVEPELKVGDAVVAKEVAETNKSKSSVPSLRPRRKVFKSPSSFSYRRLLPYLQDIDSSNFEIVDAKLPEKSLKLGNNAPNMAAHGKQEISAVSVGISLADETPKSASEEQYSKKVISEVSRNVESSDVVQDVLNDTLEECEQMTPPDADIYSKPQSDEVCEKIDGGSVDVICDDVVCGGEIEDADIINEGEVVVGDDDIINEVKVGVDDVTEKVIDEVAACEEKKADREVNSNVLVAKEVVDMNKTQSSVTSLHARRKVFKSPSSFSYRRLLSYLQDTDSSNFEIVDAKLPEKSLKLGNNALNMVAHGEQEISAVSVGINLADETPKSASEEQYLNKVNCEVSRNVESSDLVQKSLDDVLNDTLEECEQMTPPDADIYSKPKTDKMLDVVVKPKPKQVLTPCSRMKMLHTPTSFTHRRLLPFLMSVAEDGFGTLKGNQSSKVMKREPEIISNPEQHDAANEKSDSPTSTLIPVDTSVDRMKIASLVSSDNLLDTHGSDMECSGSATPLEVNLQSEAVAFDNSIELKLSPPKDNSKPVEEATVKAVESVPNTCTLQITAADNDFTGLVSSSSEDNQELVNESADQKLQQITPLMTPGILKRTPRGCRGICNCLNCTSFRLHAERSFEFSRNQMHDAEEVALELINDLTSLRKILETTASESGSLDTEKEKQIKEACEKALYKEEVAKARLSQMNEDLSFHCRSMKPMRPNVTFANKIEEKLISKDACGKKSV